MHCATSQQIFSIVGDLAVFHFGIRQVYVLFLMGLLPLQKKLAEMPGLWWDPEEQAKVSAVIADREENLTKIKPGVSTMFLIFSSRNADVVWELPLYHYYQAVLDPILEALLGKNAMKNIIRLQLAQMNPGAHIKPHRDSGPWAETCASHFSHTLLPAGVQNVVQCCRAAADRHVYPAPEAAWLAVE